DPLGQKRFYRETIRRLGTDGWLGVGWPDPGATRAPAGTSPRRAVPRRRCWPRPVSAARCS
ncbi:hypothetical protein ABTX35_40315, partial [Streptomyces sp. NPDC096080]|uniref:hypothetical protein n=1 Tax=Streptomyces sp. NPDC096080 TaxID=3156693 RepID=UPI003334269B